MTKRKSIMLIGAGIVGLLIAFASRQFIYASVIVPLAYLWWLIKLYYHLLPQAVVWILLIAALGFAGIHGLLLEIPIGKVKPLKAAKVESPLEALAELIHKSQRGNYYKWMLANRLGNIARELLDQREGKQIAQKFSRLAGRDWNPPQDVQAYLQSGISGSFADYPQKVWTKNTPSPLSLEPQKALEYLEVEMESNKNGNR